MLTRLRRSAQVCPRCTFLAADLIRAVVLAVVEEVAAQRGADALAVAARNLVLLTDGPGRGNLCWTEGSGSVKYFLSLGQLKGFLA